MQTVTNAHMHNLVEWAKDKPEVVVFSGDLTGSTEIKLFRDSYPDRFFSLGMAEQNMMSFAGGMARQGYTPFVHTFAVFMYRRALDQIEMSIAYPNLRVRMFGFLPGITTPGGVSHQAINDIGVLRSVPNMRILEMGDATDVESMLDVAQGIDGPVYIRMIRKEIPRLFPENEPMEFRRVRRITEGADLTLLSTGICTEEAMRATKTLGERGLAVDHLHATTLKPFDDPAVVESAANSKYGVITMENHNVLGGLATATAELLALNGVGARVSPIGLQDTYAHGASQQYLMKEYGLDAMSLVRRVEEVVGDSFDVTEQELAEARISEFAAEGQLEAL